MLLFPGTMIGIVVSDVCDNRLEFLKRFGDFSQGVPSQYTIARTMGMINPVTLQKCFIAWMTDCCKLLDGEVIATENGVSLGKKS